MDAAIFGQLLAGQIFMARLLVQAAAATPDPAEYIERERDLLMAHVRSSTLDSPDQRAADQVKAAMLQHLEETFQFAAQAGSPGELVVSRAIDTDG